MPIELTLGLAPFGYLPTGEVSPAHRTQQRILEWADQVRAGRARCAGLPVLYVQGGWRSGKTRAMLAVILECCEAYPGLKVLIGRKDFADIRLSTMESWRDMRPREFLAHEDKQEHREAWVNGSQVFFRELKDLAGLGGQEFGLILVSEPYELEHDVYLHLKGRLSQAGMPLMFLLDGNPVNKGHWLHRLVEGDVEHGIAPDPDVTYIEMATDENWDNLPVPYRRFIENAPPEWQQKFRLGKWGFTPSGTPVYSPPFTVSRHVRPVHLVPDRPVLRSWDSGVRHPACLWAQRTVNGHLLIGHEKLGVEVSLSEFSYAVQAWTSEWYGAERLVVDYGDPAMFNRSPQTGKSDAVVLAECHGIRLEGRQSTHQERKNLIDGLLSRVNPDDGEPVIQIDPSCQTLIDGLLGGYHYPKAPAADQPFSHKHEVPFKDSLFEHLCNCFEYLIINVFGQNVSAVTEQRMTMRERRERRRETVQRRLGVVSFMWPLLLVAVMR